MFQANIIRSERLTGEIGEYLAELQFPNSNRAGTTSNKGWDLILDNGEKLQVKAHAKGATNNARWTEVRSLDAFDRLLIVVLTPGYRLRELFSVPTAAIRKVAKLDSRGVALVSWDKLGEHKVEPTKDVKKCFPLAGRKDLKVGGGVPDSGEDTTGDGAWELLTGVNCKQLYFAPRVWRSWNVVSEGGVLATNRKLVFEYYTDDAANTGATGKITLRGLIPGGLGEGLGFNLERAVEDAKWEIPIPRGEPRITIGYAVWRKVNQLPYQRSLPYPKNGFPSEQAFFDWLAEWDAQMNPAQPNNGNTLLWNFIESVKP